MGQRATKINFDAGIIRELNVNSFNNVLVLTGTNYSLEIFEKNIKPFIKTNFHVFSNISTNLTDNIIYSAVNFAADKDIDCIISIGVESVMDCGRFASLLLSHGGFLHDYLPDGKFGCLGITPNMIHHITVPIMPAAGYEISSYSAFRADNKKHMIISQHLVPHATYIDPTIMTGLPKDLWAVILFDCFATSLMAYVSAFANPTSDQFARQALDSFINYSKKILEEPDNIEYIKHACAASVNSFLAANYSSTGAVHAVADALSANFGMRYGVALAYVCAEVCSFLYNSNKVRFDEVSDMISGKSGTAATIKGSINKMIKEMGIQLPVLKGKLADEDTERIANQAMNYAMKGSTKKVTSKDVIAILGRLK